MNRQHQTLKKEISQHQKTKSLLTSSPYELNELYKQWMLELKFWEVDLEFLKRLMGKHLLHLVDDSQIPHTHSLLNRIGILSSEIKSDQSKILHHTKKLIRLYEFKEKAGESSFIVEHEGVKEAINILRQTFWSLKKEVFEEADRILKKQKITRLTSLSG